MAKDEPFCAFCGRKRSQVSILIIGPDGANICDECAEICVKMTNDSSTAKNKSANPLTPAQVAKTAANLTAVTPLPPEEQTEIKLKTPEEIKKVLDDYVIGQDQAKKVLSVAVYNHYKRLNDKCFSKKKDAENATGKLDSKMPEALKDVDVEKSNILMIGPTGTGKTLLAKTLARVLDVPFAIADATTLTQAGYVGEDVENIIVRLYQAADEDITKTQMGIIYVDEIDKIGRKSDSASLTRDVSGEGVQQALLKIIEGTVANIPPNGGRKHPDQKYIQIDTTNILFICGGAFVELDKIVSARIGNKFLGFNVSEKTGKTLTAEQIMKELQPEDLFQFGMIPEFIGRLPINSVLSELSEDQLIHILTQPRNALVKQYQKMCALEGVELVFASDALSAIAQKAIALKTGARGLRSIMESFMLDIMYEIPNKHPKRIVITKDVVQGKPASFE